MTPKKTLLVNKFFYPRGGDCICAINLMHLLQAQGHEVAVFSMHYPENIETGWNSYYSREVSFTGPDRMAAVNRIFGGAGVKADFEKILTDFQPDVVHLHNIHSYLSPILAQLASQRHIRVVWTLHDYKLVCPTYSCLREGAVCELCFTDRSQVWKKRCMKGSLAASVLAYAEARYWNRKKLEEWVDTFICPSQFMADTMVRNGFSRDRLQVLCNFIPDSFRNEQEASVSSSSRETGSYCYVGRLSREKGLRTLLKVASGLPYTLYVAGEGPLKEELQREFPQENIRFLGQLNSAGVIALLNKVTFSVVPSEWYENNPLSVIESLCTGTPVLGARIGGIPELLQEESTGAVFEAGNEKELKEKIIYLFDPRFKRKERIRKDSLERFSAQSYYRELLKVYNGK